MSIPRHKLAVAILVLNANHEILLIKHPRRGWEFPGGFVDQGESIKVAAVREVKEESGLDIELTNFYGIDQIVTSSTCVFLFQGRVMGGTLMISNESEDACFVSLLKAKRLIQDEGYKGRLDRCLEQNGNPFINLVEHNN
ncbi:MULTISPECIES: NUDIX hydrolase [unclassified Bacillus (in: firmicutes)]|uniref:NUDIX hydrolase n=1 Tax=unclassified Bacillus (in: firmicutes) TaxID=185979 RepID=UPI0008E395D9|nr:MULTISPECIES: NUDIX hydrolase [unclassified Bacillus (in: firmicutes)]SFA77854.1 ADP-ribose pyrophosphatase YjhB, NUDIX family [Bacillus sp. UNCCL13]SFQ67738.1 ADP-ribose pyrophosphatase YjhB, NUDIX family [Bacillus sp. cl95]